MDGLLLAPTSPLSDVDLGLVSTLTTGWVPRRVSRHVPPTHRRDEMKSFGGTSGFLPTLVLARLSAGEAQVPQV